MVKSFVFYSLMGVSLFALGSEESDGGGFLAIWPENHGRFLYVNAQSAIKHDVVIDLAHRQAAAFGVDVKSVKGDVPDIRTIPARLAGLGVKGAIWVVNDPAFPPSLGAVESGWGILNVAQVLSEKSDEKSRSDLLLKLSNRLFASIHGIGDSTMMPACVMKQAVGLEGVSNVKCRNFSPEAHAKISSFLNMSGYKARKCGTYYEACEEGWAPAPTNDVQRKIWNEVHQLPTKPIRILPPGQRK